MKVKITIPNMGESVAEATIATIIQSSGTLVQQDEEILELETDKINQILYAPASGKLMLTVSAQDQVRPFQEIGWIETQVGVAKKAPPLAEQSPPPSPPSPSSEGQGIQRSVDQYLSSLNEPKKTPLEKKETPFPSESKGKESRKPLSTLRKTLAKRLVEVKNTTAMLTTFNEVDMSSILEIRSREKESFIKNHGVKLGLLSFFVKACCFAIKEHPEVNAFIDGDEIVYPNQTNIGISVSTPKGLIVPVIKGADALSFASIEKKIALLAQKGREGTIHIQDLQGGTFTITNGGVFGSLFSTPILNPPQSAILGMHHIVKRPVVIEDQITIRPIMYLALSYDHRMIDGKEGVTFLLRVKEFLEKPEKFFLEQTDG